MAAMAAARPPLPSPFAPSPLRREESRLRLKPPLGQRRQHRASPAVTAHLSLLPDTLLLLNASGEVGYSPASYYTSLGLFVISVPGLWSLIKRSVKSKIVQKSFVREEGAAAAPNQVAGEIFSFFTRNNFSVTDRGETITYLGAWCGTHADSTTQHHSSSITNGILSMTYAITVRVELMLKPTGLPHAIYNDSDTDSG